MKKLLILALVVLLTGCSTAPKPQVAIVPLPYPLLGAADGVAAQLFVK